jgi:hypothetical protein
LLDLAEPSSGENAVRRVSGVPSFLYESALPVDECGDDALNAVSRGCDILTRTVVALLSAQNWFAKRTTAKAAAGSNWLTIIASQPRTRLGSRAGSRMWLWERDEGEGERKLKESKGTVTVGGFGLF